MSKSIGHILGDVPYDDPREYLKDIYNAESVYLCTMCDGPMNHFHIQLIPRYSFEKRGSKNFVKPRFEYKEDKEKLLELRKQLNYKVGE